MAVEQRDVEIVRALLGHGADPNARWCVPVHPERGPHVYRPEPGCTEPSGITPLMFAASLGDLDVLGALLERHDIGLELQDWSGRTALESRSRPGVPMRRTS